MAEIQWGLLQTPDIAGNALAAFDKGREMKRSEMARNALSTLVQNPGDQASFGQLAQADPAMAMQYQKINKDQQRQAQMAQLLPKALAGDATALQQVMGVDFDTWKSLDSRQRDQVKQQNDYIGQSALQISRLPVQQQAQAWDQAIQQGVQMGYQGLGQYAGKYSPQALQSAAANAGLVGKFIELAEPKYTAIPAGGTLVNTRDPNAVQQFQGGTPAPQNPKPAVPQDKFTMEMYRGAVNGLGPQGAAEWMQRQGIVVHVTTPNEARQLPRGTKVILPDGSEGVVP